MAEAEVKSFPRVRQERNDALKEEYPRLSVIL